MERLLSDAEKISGQKYDISNLSDVYEAIHVMQTELDITGTSSKEAATTLSGSFASMKAAADNLLGDLALGRNIGPAMVGLAESAGTFLFGNLLPAIGRVFKSLPVAISALIQTGMPKFMEAGSKMIDGIITGVQKSSSKLAENLPGMVQSALDKITKNLPAALDKGRQLVVSLVQGVLSNMPQLLSVAQSIAEKIPDFLQKNIPVIAAKGGQLLGQLAVTLIKNLPKIVSAVAKLDLTIIKGILKMVPTILKAGKNLVMNFAKGLGGAALAAVKGAAKKIVTALLQPISAIGGKIRGYANTVRSILSFSGLAAKVRGVWNSVKSAITGPIESAKNTVSGIIKKIKGFFPLGGGRLFSGLKLPHFSVSGGKFPFGVAGKGSLPKWNVSWYRKAMEEPYMFTKPTVMARGFGDAGDELVYGKKALMDDIREANGDRPQNVTMNFYMQVDGAEDPESWGRGFIRGVKMQARTV